MDSLNSQKKVLIAFLGRANYQETAYCINDMIYKERLAFLAIHKHFSPIEKTYVIGTQESAWDLLKDFSYTPIHIPYGRSEGEFWEIFDILRNSIHIKDSQVIFDFTHGFRVLPLFGAIFVRLLNYIEPTALSFKIFYGSFEPGKNETPLVDMSPFIELLDWIDAVNAFIRYGELEALSSKVHEKNKKAYVQGKSQLPKRLGAFSRKLDTLSKILHLTYTPLLDEASIQILSMLDDESLQEECDKFVKPFSLLLDRLRDFTATFKKPTIWESHLSVARWYWENNRLTQALLVLRETIITMLCEMEKCDVYDIERREHLTKQLNEKSRDSEDPIHKLWNKIIKLRNNVGHAFMKKKDFEADPKRVSQKVKEVIEEAENILRGNQW